MRKKIIILLIMIFAVALCVGCSEDDKEFKSWNDNASLDALKAYVEDVTDEQSENFIPEEDRVAMFDMDGTLYCETAPTYLENLLLIERCLNDASYTPSDKLQKQAMEVKNSVEKGVNPDENMTTEMYAEAFKDLSLSEMEKFVEDYVDNHEAEGLDDVNYGNAFFIPMVEIVDYLNANGFSCWICSGTDRTTCRALLKDNVDIPSQNIIGADVRLQASGQGNTPGSDYVLAEDDEIVRTAEHYGGNIKADKVTSISQALGKQPVLAFGNSTGDISMMIYTTRNNKYKAAGFMVLADDEVRNNGDVEDAAERKEIWDSYGWYSFSMKNDFKTIYGEF